MHRIYKKKAATYTPILKRRFSILTVQSSLFNMVPISQGNLIAVRAQLNRAENVQECDARMFHAGNTAGLKIIFPGHKHIIFIAIPFQNYFLFKFLILLLDRFHQTV